MTPRTSLLALILVTLVVAVLVACGGDDGEEVEPGSLTNPREVPTSTLWASPPPVVIIDPNAIQPLPPVGPGVTPTPSASPGAEEASESPAAGTCGPVYTVVAGDSPSTIADKCGVTTQAILDANPGLDPRTMHIGDEVNIPAATEEEG